jgi:hypothetical protein
MLGNYPSNNCVQPFVITEQSHPHFIQQAPGCSTPLLLGGDVIGYANDNRVDKIQNVKWSPVKPVVGQIPQYDNSGQWSFVTPTAFGTISVVSGGGLVLTGSELSINYPSLIGNGDLITNAGADLRYLRLTGGTVTGNITVNGNTELAGLSTTGVVNHSILSGTGTRMVTVSATGDLSFATLPTVTSITMNSLGSGKRVFKNFDSLTGVAEFGTLVAGTGIDLVDTPTGVTISSTVTPEILTFTNLGATGAGIFKAKLPNGTVELYRISAGQNVVLNQNANFIEIAVPTIGEVNDLVSPSAQVVNSAGIRIGKPGVSVEVRRIRGVSNITVTENGGYIDLAATNDQQLAISGNTLSISGGNSVTLPSTTITVADSATVDLNLSGTTLSATTALRYNGVNVTPPSGFTPVGFNFTSSGTIAITNPSAGVINLEATGIQGYFTKDINTTGNLNATVGTNSQVVAFTGTWTANRNVTLQSAGAVLGSRIELSTVNATLGAFTLNVIDQVSGLTIQSSTLSTRFIFIFDGANWIKFG